MGQTQDALDRGRCEPLALPNLRLAQPLGRLCEPPVEADEGCAVFGGRKMESVHEVHSLSVPIWTGGKP
jgi:hypothetical protein